QLRLVFRVGKIFAITPSSMEIKNQSTSQKYYSCLVIAFYTVGVLVSCCYRKDYYIQYIHIKLAIQIILDSSLYVLNICTVLIALNKRSQWFKLIKNFKITQEGSENVKEKSHLLRFSISNLFFWGIMLHMTYIFTSLMGVDFFKQYAIEYVQLYVQFFLQILLCFDSIFQKSSIGDFERILGNIAIIFLFCCGATINILLADSILQETEAVLALSYKLERYFLNRISRESDELRQFINVVIDNFPKFSAARFFTIDRSTIFRIFEAVTTFLIILIQFESKQEPHLIKCTDCCSRCNCNETAII
ncbi:7tm 7 domain containing protein, partial [Asbolus verrucosus]